MVNTEQSGLKSAYHMDSLKVLKVYQQLQYTKKDINKLQWKSKATGSALDKILASVSTCVIVC